MQIDLETGSEISSENLLGLLIEAFAAGEAAGKRPDHFLRIHSSFCPENQAFSDGGKIDRHDDLIGKLCKTAGAKRPHMRDGFAESVENRKSPLEIACFAAGHDRQSGVDRAFF